MHTPVAPLILGKGPRILQQAHLVMGYAPEHRFTSLKSGCGFSFLSDR